VSPAPAKDGITPGSTVKAQGVSYTFPDVQPCTQDNILADGQTILVNGTSSDTKLGILGMTSNGPLTEPVTINYADGTSSTANVTLNDWAGGPGSGDVSVATMPYRNYYDGTSQTIQMWLYSTTVPLTAGKTVASITLPDLGTDVSNSAFHIFDIAAGS
jgi:hypothetical protein